MSNRSVGFLFLWGVTLPSLAVGQSYTDLVVFGDSLSDAGNLAHRDRIPPSPPYYRGRLTNGPVRVDILADRLNLPRPSASETGGANYSWGGATTGSVESISNVPDMEQQVATYLGSHSPQSGELFAIWIGVNDFNQNQTDAGAAASMLTGHLEDLIEHGANRFLVVNLPDRLGRLSYPLAMTFNQEISRNIAELRESHPNLTIDEFDYFEFQMVLENNPDVFGFANVRDPACRDCRFGGFPNPSNVVPDADAYMFWDRIHPSSRTHQLMGEAVWNTLLLRRGDYDQNGELGIPDLDLLQSAIRTGGDQIAFEADRNWVLNYNDQETWVRDFANSYFGDTNLDGEFNSTDLVSVFQVGQYEDDIMGNSSWATGDWDADGEFTSADLVIAFQDGGYEKGPRMPAPAVPEPSGIVMFALAIRAVLRLGRNGDYGVMPTISTDMS